MLTRELTAKNFKRYVDVVVRLWKRGHKLVVVCGGGKVCREYRDIGKAFGADWKLLDRIGIVATHLNAAVFVSGLIGSGVGKVHWVDLKREKEAVKEVKKRFGKKIVVGAGYEPGHSTDYDAAIFAKAVGADLIINASNVDGVYTDDPKQNPNAKKFRRLSYDEFIRIIKRNVQSPGEYRLFDLAGAKVIKKAKIKTVIIDGSNHEEILRAAEGKHSGSVVG